MLILRVYKIKRADKLLKNSKRAKMAFKTELDMSDVLGLIGNDIKIRVSPDEKHVILFDEVSYSSAFYRLESKGNRQLSYIIAKLEEVKGNYHFTSHTEVRAIGSPTFDLGEF